jgi:polyhydroxyalkanoate synthesis regulator phasin
VLQHQAKTKLKKLNRKVKIMSKELEIERLQKENAELKAKVTALENVVSGMNTFFKGDGH